MGSADHPEDLAEVERQLEEADPSEHVRILVAAASRRLRKDNDAAFDLARRALSESDRGASDADRCEATRIIGIIHGFRGELDESILFLTQAHSIAERANLSSQFVKITTDIGTAYWYGGNLGEALDWYRESLKLVGSKSKFENHRALVLSNTGNLLRIMGRFDEALEHLYEGEKISRRLGLKVGLADTLLNIGTALDAQKRAPEAMRYYQDALAAYVDLDHLRGQAACHTNIGSSYFYLGDYQAAAEAGESALRLTEEIGDRQGQGFARNNLGEIFAAIGDDKRAEEHLEKALEIKRALGKGAWPASTMQNLGDLYFRTKRAKEGEKIYREAIKLACEEQDGVHLPRLKLGLAAHLSERNPEESAKLAREALELFKQTGRPVGSIRAMVLLLRLETSAGNDKEAEALFATLSESVDQKLDPQVQIEFAEEKSRYLVHRSNFEGAVEALRELRDLEERYKNRRLRDRVEQLLLIYGVERDRQQREIAEREAEVLKIENEQLLEQQRLARKEIEQSALLLTQKTDLLKRLQRSLDKASKADDPLSEIQRLEQEVRSSLEADHLELTLEQDLESVHGEYMQMLSSRFSSLTPTELRVCALLKMGLPTKQCANVLNVELRSVEKYRQRIRKKLDLASGVNLTSYLTALE